MFHIWRAAISTRARCLVLESKKALTLVENSNVPKSYLDERLAAFSSLAVRRIGVQNSTKRLPAALESGSIRLATADANQMTKNLLGANGIAEFRGLQTGEYAIRLRLPYQLMKDNGTKTVSPYFSRSFASRTSRQSRQTQSETKKQVANIEDPFDSPTYHIPEKPVTFTEGASYSVIILAGLGLAAAAGYAVFKELIFEPKEYRIFNKALKRIQDDSQVRVRIGSPITGYGQESRNRAARQRIPNRIYTDENGVEHVEVNFYIRGPNGAGKVFAEMFKDKEDKQWKYTYLIVEIMAPSPKQLILESYLPA